MKMIKITIIPVAVIIGLILIARPSLYLYNECAVYFHKKAFISKYEFEDFSQFNGVCCYIRGVDENKNPIIFANPECGNITPYIIVLDKKNYQVIRTRWEITADRVITDTIKLQQLAQAFMKYEIPRLDVDEQGNVFVYLKDFETLGLSRFVNESELLKNPNKKWKNIKSNWYKPK
jgi:hypothetical protein